jgi:hypothetical protein
MASTLPNSSIPVNPNCEMRGLRSASSRRSRSGNSASRQSCWALTWVRQLHTHREICPQLRAKPLLPSLREVADREVTRPEIASTTSRKLPAAASCSSCRPTRRTSRPSSRRSPRSRRCCVGWARGHVTPSSRHCAWPLRRSPATMQPLGSVTQGTPCPTKELERCSRLAAIGRVLVSWDERDA